MSEDPWKGIATPVATDAITARRVDPDTPWGFFWGRSVDQKYLFVLRHNQESAPTSKLPNLKGIDVSILDRAGDADKMLVFKLQDSLQRELFQGFCSNIFAGASRAGTEKEAVAVTLARTWRWHHLLRGGSDDRLSPEEQKGLIGELFILQRQFMVCLPTKDALDAWRGPLGSPKDFESGRICAEAKARRGAASPYVAISSSHQLDDAGTDALFLYVVELDQAPSGVFGSFTLTDVATRLRSAVIGDGESVGEALEILLAAAGFRWSDDYSDSRWVEGRSHLYKVSHGFPRITTTSLTAGVANVKYSISLPDCSAFLVNDDALMNALKERQHVH